MNAAASKNVLETFRDVVQDLLVPELKAIKVEMKLGDEKLEAAIRHLADRFESLRDEMRLRDAAMERMITYGDQRNEQLLLSFAERFGQTMDLRERLARLEGQRPPQ